MNYVWAFLSSLVVTIGLSELAVWLFPKIGLMDRPQKYGLKRAPIPYYGGLVLVVAFLVCLPWFVNVDSKMVGVVLAGMLIVVVSFLDDWFGLPAWLRLMVQVLAGVILVVGGVVLTDVQIPLVGNVSLLGFGELEVGGGVVPLIGALFTVIWVVVIMNSLNFLDGISGLTSGVSAVGLLILFLLSIRPDFHAIDQGNLSMLCLILLASCLAILRKDFFPAKMLIGDTGSMFLGFMLASLSLLAGGKVATAFLILGFPIVDACLVVLRRILNGNSPFKGDYTHIHHRLLGIGFSERTTIFLIYGLCFGFGLVGVFLESIGKFFAVVMVFGVMVLIEFLISRRE